MNVVEFFLNHALDIVVARVVGHRQCEIFITLGQHGPNRLLGVVGAVMTENKN
jgi:hypothetical protein